MAKRRIHRMLGMALGALLGVGAARGAGAGVAPDEWLVAASRTTLIGATVDEGGAGGSVAALWSVDAPFAARFGLTAFAADQGAALTRLKSTGNPSVDLGVTEREHAAVFGAAWRGDAEWEAGSWWAPFASGTWGYYRCDGDHLGRAARAASAVGFSLAGGVRFGPREQGGPGAFVRYHRIFNDETWRFVSVGLEWQWRTSAR